MNSSPLSGTLLLRARKSSRFALWAVRRFVACGRLQSWLDVHSSASASCRLPVATCERISHQTLAAIWRATRPDASLVLPYQYPLLLRSSVRLAQACEFESQSESEFESQSQSRWLIALWIWSRYKRYKLY